MSMVMIQKDKAETTVYAIYATKYTSYPICINLHILLPYSRSTLQYQ